VHSIGSSANVVEIAAMLLLLAHPARQGACWT
jgi:hypothetical protein